MSPEVSALKRQSRGVAFAGGAVILCFGLVWGASQPRWLLGSLSVWAYCLWLLFRHLEENRGQGDVGPRASIGLATAVTLVRGALLAVAAGFLFVPMATGWGEWVPAVTYSLASILDHVDGRVARALQRTTRLGETLDMELDAAGILIASALAIHYGKLPVWYLAIGLARYAFVAGLWWRRRRGLRTEPLDPSSTRRLLAGVQMGFLSVSLWPPVAAELTGLLAPGFGGITLAMFLRDWLQVSARLPRRA